MLADISLTAVFSTAARIERLKIMGLSLAFLRAMALPVDC